ncbi:mitochondrial ribosome-associated GTPase 2-like isoform X2 [Lytechinus variegatus]|nr:mitochondrial ribosome-associated GTPase 2-like isoform X2 [Lytechinus variegatus]XP_041453931.1 mitochondrial ribosome-associated GTPase 2-like isoform X2 [Lytechinus variegatus]
MMASLLHHHLLQYSQLFQLYHMRTIQRMMSSITTKRRKNLSEKKLSKHFVDWRRVRVVGGKGGDGCVSVRREAHVEFGGPDGGDGGHGGHVILESNQSIKSLERVLPLYRGEAGGNGRNQNRHGRNGKHTVIKVPLGTLVKENDVIIKDLENEHDTYMLAAGGEGGRGNRSFVTSQHKTPMMATCGTQGEERLLNLELRTMAHVGLIGFPNAGKSTLLRALSRARPAVAAYPFTTLNPHVGMVMYDDLEQVAVADIPGLIRGAHQNRGLGHSFLRHIERCRCLLYVIDLSVKEPWSQLADLRYELEQYQPGLSERPHAVVGNKIDLEVSRTNLMEFQDKIQIPVIAISAQLKNNIEPLKKHIRKLYDQDMKEDNKAKQSLGGRTVQNPVKRIL